MRLVTGLVALAILAMPAGRHVAEWTTRPIADRVITVAALPPLEPLILQPRARDSATLQPAVAAAARPPQWSASAGPAFAPEREELRAQAAPHRGARPASARHRAAVYARIARGKPGLTRAQVVREYIASREQVAALTREDSGSAYLMRLAARRHASTSAR